MVGWISYFAAGAKASVTKSRPQSQALTTAAVVGTVEELSTSPRSLALVREQFNTSYFGPVNIIRAALPAMRKHVSGHIIVITGISGSLSRCSKVLS